MTTSSFISRVTGGTGAVARWSGGLAVAGGRPSQAGDLLAALDRNLGPASAADDVVDLLDSDPFEDADIAVVLETDDGLEIVVKGNTQARTESGDLISGPELVRRSLDGTVGLWVGLEDPPDERSHPIMSLHAGVVPGSGATLHRVSGGGAFPVDESHLAELPDPPEQTVIVEDIDLSSETTLVPTAKPRRTPESSRGALAVLVTTLAIIGIALAAVFIYEASRSDPDANLSRAAADSVQELDETAGSTSGENTQDAAVTTDDIATEEADSDDPATGDAPGPSPGSAPSDLEDTAARVVVLGDVPVVASAVWAEAMSPDGTFIDQLSVVPVAAPSLCLSWEFADAVVGSESRVDWSFNGDVIAEASTGGVVLEQASGELYACLEPLDGTQAGIYEVLWTVEGDLVFGEAIRVSDDEPGRLAVQNFSDVAVCVAQFGPTGSTGPAINELDGAIEPGSSAGFVTPRGALDVRIVDCDGRVVLDESAIDAQDSLTLTVR